MLRVQVAIAAALVGCALSRDAGACSIAGAEPFVIDGTPQGAAPPPPKDLAFTVTRGKAPKDGGASTCDDLGIVKITLTPPAGDVAFVVDQVSGTLPDGVSLSPTPIRLAGLQIVWTDGATDSQERIDFTVRLASVDRAGQQSAWSAPLHITDGGGGAASPASCAASRGTTSCDGALAALTVVGLALGLRRRTAISR